MKTLPFYLYILFLKIQSSTLCQISRNLKLALHRDFFIHIINIMFIFFVKIYAKILDCEKYMYLLIFLESKDKKCGGVNIYSTLRNETGN